MVTSYNSLRTTGQFLENAKMANVSDLTALDGVAVASYNFGYESHALWPNSVRNFSQIVRGHEFDLL